MTDTMTDAKRAFDLAQDALCLEDTATDLKYEAGFEDPFDPGDPEDHYYLQNALYIEWVDDKDAVIDTIKDSIHPKHKPGAGNKIKFQDGSVWKIDDENEIISES